MSEGHVVCSVCKRTAGQEGREDPKTRRRRWFHYEDGTDICEGGHVIYAEAEPTIMLNYYPLEKGVE